MDYLNTQASESENDKGIALRKLLNHIYEEVFDNSFQLPDLQNLYLNESILIKIKIDNHHFN